MGSQKPRNGDMAAGVGYAEWGLAVGGAKVAACARLQKLPDDVQKAVVAGNVQRRAAAPVVDWLVNGGTCSDQ